VLRPPTWAFDGPTRIHLEFLDRLTALAGKSR
jgi:hypothetical protein